MGPERNGQNGNGWKTWVLGILVTIVIALSSIAWSGQERRIINIEEHGAVPASVLERLATVEAQAQSTHELLDRITRQLDRIEQRQLNQAAQFAQERR